MYNTFPNNNPFFHGLTIQVIFQLPRREQVEPGIVYRLIWFIIMRLNLGRTAYRGLSTRSNQE